jgi:L-lactate dehydrogenase complex protein LldF
MYHLLMRIGIPLMSRFGRRRGTLGWLPLANGWTDTRDLPSPQGQTFQQAWSARRGARP